MKTLVLSGLTALQTEDWRNAIRTIIKDTPFDNSDVDFGRFSDVEIVVSNDKLEVWVNSVSLQEYSHVLFFGGVAKNLRIASPLAKILKAHDSIHSQTNGAESFQGIDKIAQYVDYKLSGISIPHSYFASARNMIKNIEEKVGFPAIVKDSIGAEGTRNYLIHSSAELAQKDKLTDTFVAQRFIENDGDIRVLTHKSGAHFAYKRSATDGSHLNNISRGGSAVEVTDLPQEIIDHCVNIVNMYKLDFAGLDVMFDNNGQYYFLEYNLQPGIIGGAFQEKKWDFVNRFLKS